MLYQYSHRLGAYAPGLDPDAKAYIAAVEAADAQALESGVKAAYDTFIRGCKADGIWDAIKASCILAGARTLSGALVPLKGIAPTNNNFVSGDYDRETGLIGDGSTKYLNSNRNNNADPQDNQSMGVYITQEGISAGDSAFAGAGGNATGANVIARNITANLYVLRCRNNTADTTALGSWAGTNAISRSNSSEYVSRRNGVSITNTRSSQTPYNGNIGIFARESSGSFGLFSDDKIAFYFIGESLDLAALDSRVSRLVAELVFTINTGLVATPYDIDTLLYVNSGYNAGGTLA